MFDHAIDTPPFYVVPGGVIADILDRNTAGLIDTVAETYLAHEKGQTTNPDSYFLKFPEKDLRRIIALPAALHGDNGISGIKWIASYPSNLDKGLQRASAVLVLNDAETGYPIALLECGRISAVRTAASAVLGAYWLNGKTRKAGTLSIIGGGYIARNIAEVFKADGWDFDSVLVHDLDAASAKALSGFTSEKLGYSSKQVDQKTALEADVVAFATNAGTPYVKPPNAFKNGQIVLNISLRDIAPELVLECDNYFDDVSHCLKANTSPHLAEQLAGHQDFVTGTIGQVIRGEVSVDASRPKIYSPFGMGILDLALGQSLLQTALDENTAIEVPGFLGDVTRW
jgi:2,3-diaminopropionate biosynthesis protein SbnB